MKLDKPVAWFDTETTGADPESSRIVSLAIVKVFPDGTRDKRNRLVNPTIPIPAAATRVHGITDEMVKDQPTFKQLSKGVAAYIEGCILGGYNIRKFDWPLMLNEFKRAGLIVPARRLLIDAMSIFQVQHPRNLQAAHRVYVGSEFDGAHEALADVEAAERVFSKQLETDLPDTVEALQEYCWPGAIDMESKFVFDDTGAPVCNFGQHRGTPMRDLDDGFWNWIIKKDFSDEVKQLAKDALKKVYPTK